MLHVQASALVPACRVATAPPLCCSSGCAHPWCSSIPTACDPGCNLAGCCWSMRQFTALNLQQQQQRQAAALRQRKERRDRRMLGAGLARGPAAARPPPGETWPWGSCLSTRRPRRQWGRALNGDCAARQRLLLTCKPNPSTVRTNLRIGDMQAQACHQPALQACQSASATNGYRAKGSVCEMRCSVGPPGWQVGQPRRFTPTVSAPSLLRRCMSMTGTLRQAALEASHVGTAVSLLSSSRNSPLSSHRMSRKHSLRQPGVAPRGMWRPVPNRPGLQPLRALLGPVLCGVEPGLHPGSDILWARSQKQAEQQLNWRSVDHGQAGQG